MREIEFRVWCKTKKEWETDSISLLPNGLLLHTNKNGIRRIISRINHIVEFYMGRKDKNNKKIFEGDIIVGNSNMDGSLCGVPLFVYWDIYKKGWALRNKKDPDREIWFFNEESKEIIGNIHDNPEQKGGEHNG